MKHKIRIVLSATCQGCGTTTCEIYDCGLCEECHTLTNEEILEHRKIIDKINDDMLRQAEKLCA